MMTTTLGVFEAASKANRRLLRQEELILEVTEALCEALERQGVTRTQVAKRMGRSKGFVSQLLGGGRNLTLRTLADVADALGCVIRVNVERRGMVDAEVDLRRFEVANWQRRAVPFRAPVWPSRPQNTSNSTAAAA